MLVHIDLCFADAESCLCAECVRDHGGAALDFDCAQYRLPREIIRRQVHDEEFVDDPHDRDAGENSAPKTHTQNEYCQTYSLSLSIYLSLSLSI